MLASSPKGAGINRYPLSPTVQATIEKHLPSLQNKRLIQQNKVQTCEVGCVTGNCLITVFNFNSLLSYQFKVAHVVDGKFYWVQTMRPINS